jgi:hypothetical protein
MKRNLIAVASAAVIGLTAVAIPNKAEANWRGGWWVPGAVIGGIALGAAIASRPYYYVPTTTAEVPTTADAAGGATDVECAVGGNRI